MCTTAPFLDDAYLKKLYGGRRPSMGRVFAFYSERLRHLVKAREFEWCGSRRKCCVGYRIGSR